ncbi:hypothetical protein [Niabella aquatica]
MNRLPQPEITRQYFVWITETGMVLSEINYFLKHTEELAAPQNGYEPFKTA